MIRYPITYNPILEYWNKIESGEEIVSLKIYRTYKEAARKINDPECKYYYDSKAANHAIEFIENFCKHSKGRVAGKPFILELWQKAMTAYIFGFLDKETGLRMVKEAMLLIGRKNGEDLPL